MAKLKLAQCLDCLVVWEMENAPVQWQGTQWGTGIRCPKCGRELLRANKNNTLPRKTWPKPLSKPLVTLGPPRDELPPAA